MFNVCLMCVFNCSVFDVCLIVVGVCVKEKNTPNIKYLPFNHESGKDGVNELGFLDRYLKPYFSSCKSLIICGLNNPAR